MIEDSRRGRGNIYYRLKNYEAVVADYHAYERITGQLEPFMIDRIAEMEAVLNNN
ncbi:MAG: hypothetical protein ACPG7F_01350 [Aggregatilineales bacterium]